MTYLNQQFYEKFKHIDLFVWDFDQTVTNISTLRLRFDYNSNNDYIMSFIADPDFFRNLVLFLIKNNKKVAIASWNDKRFFNNGFGGVKLIRHFMNIVFGASIFDSNNIVSFMPASTKDGKNNHLDILSKKFNIPKYKIILFDDNHKNIKNALNYGYNAIQVPENGFTKEYITHIL